MISIKMKNSKEYRFYQKCCFVINYNYVRELLPKTLMFF